MSSSTHHQVASLRGLVPLLRRAQGFAEVAGALRCGQSAAIDGAWGSSCALTAAALLDGPQSPSPEMAGGAGAPERSQTGGWLVVVLPRISEVDDFAVDLAGFLGENPRIFPAWESMPQEQSAVDPVFTGRMRVLQELVPLSVASASAPQTQTSDGSEDQRTASDGSAPIRVIVTSLPALLQPVPDRDELRRSTRSLRVADELDPEELVWWLIAQRFERVAAIELPGEFSMHGGILDVFSHTDSEPLRIEFFGDQIESIRRFDVATQKKIADLQEVGLMVVRPGGNGQEPAAQGDPASGAGGSAHFVDWLPCGSWIALVEPAQLREEGRHFLGRLDNPHGLFGVEATFQRCIERPTVTIAALSADGFETTCHLRIQSVERFDVPAAEVIGELAKVVGRDERVLIVCHNAGEQQRLSELLAETDLPGTGRVELLQGFLLRGFRLADERLIVLSDHELFGRRDIRRGTPAAGKARLESRAIDSFLELTEGDYVVHLAKGIARYRGMQLLTQGDQQEEHLVLEFRDAVKMFVPVSLIHLVQKYVGGGNSAPTLSKVGTGSWERKKQAVANAVSDLAGDMLVLQAARDAKTGLAFPPDSHWQEEFEASFPYVATPDQVTAIGALKQDMQKPRPMDRLICGDVGYGKTEVALRGAFKAIDAGKQVAVLVPTTVLAEQHFRTFSERLAEFPFSIEVLSRFRTKGQQRGVLAGLAEGRVDLVVGTHRLIQADVKFSDLGLLIIDEEQRFGVEAKERLKRLRLEVDVLTLSATPIPRTLHLSLLGIRDISNLQTPPHDRLAIETRICRFDAELVRQAIVREMNRSGQIYFVHNRVYDIESIADRLQSIVPEARIGIVHGQMAEHELEETMVAFVNARLDVLVATTIIESGLDIPNANTILIHQADKYGLADLHQLRGRVGRYKHRAYCYLMLEEGQSLTSTAAKRLRAIEEFSELGAGFKIAMRDLEIRGAGNILGTEQSGHIASVGYELYCQLLENAVRRLKHQPVREIRHVAIDLPVAAYLPGSYVPPGRHKIEVYRRFSRIESLVQLDDVAGELRDRFGPLPEPACHLIELKRIQLLAQTWQIDDIHLEREFIVFGYRQPKRIQELAERSGGGLRIVDGRSAYLVLTPPESGEIPLLERLKVLLQQSESSL
ncbi:MAG: transcription-repair coupling factor [Planctomycetales bacterium]